MGCPQWRRQTCCSNCLRGDPLLMMNRTIARCGAAAAGPLFYTLALALLLLQLPICSAGGGMLY